jgi:hypothetical protein
LKGQFLAGVLAWHAGAFDEAVPENAGSDEQVDFVPGQGQPLSLLLSQCQFPERYFAL